MLNVTLVSRGSVHQGHSRFSNISRGRQHAFMSSSVVMCANLCDISTWTTETVNRVLVEGDSRFLKHSKKGLYPMQRLFLSIICQIKSLDLR